MRSMIAEIGGEKRELVANYKASMEIANKVADPIYIARQAAIEESMRSRGFPWTPDFAFNVENVVQILSIALGAKRDDVQEWVFDMGFDEAVGLAGDYLSLIVTAKPQSVRAESSSGE